MKKEARHSILGAVLITASLLFVFQNCSGVSFSSSGGDDQKQGGGTTTQGTPVADTQTFNFGASSNSVDILIVDDNSGSMQQEQANLGAGFNNFISDLAGIDWQIAVTTTDTAGKGQFVGPADQASSLPYSLNYVLTPSTTNVATLFSETVQRTTSAGKYLSGSGDERGIITAGMSITNEPSFFRTGANLVVVILSDEDERSCGGNVNAPSYDGNTLVTCGTDGDADDSEPLQTADMPQTLINQFGSAFGGTKNVVVDAIITKPGDSACFALQNAGGAYGTGGHYGYTYASLVSSTGGVLGSICDNGSGGFTADLSNISSSIKNTVNPKTISLAYVPISAPTVTLSPANSAITYTWTPGTQQIVFNTYPASETITVSYSHY